MKIDLCSRVCIALPRPIRYHSVLSAPRATRWLASIACAMMLSHIPLWPSGLPSQSRCFYLPPSCLTLAPPNGSPRWTPPACRNAVQAR
eukprot:scaffold309374_cov33-Tisochrysis_lutea.AAC.1